MALKKIPTLKLKNMRNYFLEFAKSQQFAGVLLICCTIISLTLSNSGMSQTWLHFIHNSIFDIKLEWIVNDVLMSVFFLLVGLEIRRELLVGELSNRKTAALPIAAAIGGMIVPAIVFVIFNLGKHSIKGWAIPTATDIAFAVGILNLLGNRVPMALKIFITALAVVDDLGAVLVIALFYSSKINILYLFFLLLAIPISNFLLKQKSKYFYLKYLLVAAVFFQLLHQAHLHTTLAGVLLAAITPYSRNDENSYLNIIEHTLNKPVNYFIIPVFAIFNTAIVLENNLLNNLNWNLFLGIFLGLLLGKPIGITLFSYLACKLKIAELPSNININKIFVVSILGGIGFTMSIFISLLAFKETFLIEESKLVVLIASTLAGVIGFIALKLSFKLYKE